MKRRDFLSLIAGLPIAAALGQLFSFGCKEQKPSKPSPKVQVKEIKAPSTNQIYSFGFSLWEELGKTPDGCKVFYHPVEFGDKK